MVTIPCVPHMPISSALSYYINRKTIQHRRTNVLDKGPIPCPSAKPLSILHITDYCNSHRKCGTNPTRKGLFQVDGKPELEDIFPGDGALRQQTCASCVGQVLKAERRIREGGHECTPLTSQLTAGSECCMFQDNECSPSIPPGRLEGSIFRILFLIHPL